MFKNLKIGVKIITGFGSVVAMMLIIAVIILVTNLQTIRNVETINKNTKLQMLATTLFQDCLNARVPANQLIYVSSPDVFNEFKAFIPEIESDLEAIYSYIDSEPSLEKFRAGIKETETALNTWIELANSLGGYNEQEVVSGEELRGHGHDVFELNERLLSSQISILEQEVSTNSPKPVILKNIEDMKNVESITNLVTAFRINANITLSTYNTTLVPETVDMINQVIDKLNVLENTVNISAQKSNAQEFTAVLGKYIEALNIFAAACDKATEVSEIMPQTNLQAQENLFIALDMINNEVNNQIATTESSSFATLIIIMVVVGISLFLSILQALIIMRGITKPVKAMHNIIAKVGETGSLKFTAAERKELEASASKDEIGESLSAFTKMLDRLIIIAESLEKIANCDLTATIKPISQNDTMGNALMFMLDNLNDMFKNINVAAEQVNSGSQQVSGASQALAQGATEQASAVQQLSASIQEISDQVNDNSSNAEKASTVADETGVEVAHGNGQMKQMLDAMDEINASSSEISKIIMVIDSIASQTNILALNAAVEAARAGDAGKGFAVVAEEVRNLASKSADAAKQTNALIANSIESVSKGAAIAKKTAESLTLVETKAKNVNTFVTDIAGASREQAQGISQINIGVEQISSVVQTNSATAEESAAAAQELSGQASMLSEQIAKFKLRY